MQMDLIRQQLEFEAQHIRSLMEERFGTSDEMVQRAQVQPGCGWGAGPPASGRIESRNGCGRGCVRRRSLMPEGESRAEMAVGGACSWAESDARGRAQEPTPVGGV